MADLEERIARAASGRGPAPVESWNPPFCGDLDIRIARDGAWFYMGTPIGRPALAALFASVLRKDADGKTYLVTPVEKIGIEVEDAPFVVDSLSVTGKGRDMALQFTTNMGDVVTAGKEHSLRFAREAGGGYRPYVHIRGRLEALVRRALYYDLVELGQEHDVDGTACFGLWSGGVFFPLCPMSELGEQ